MLPLVAAAGETVPESFRCLSILRVNIGLDRVGALLSSVGSVDRIGFDSS